MPLYQIQEKGASQWDGTSDNENVFYALDCGRTCGDRETVAQKWRWLADAIGELYNKSETRDEAAACFSYCHGWIDGASCILGKAVSQTLLRSRVGEV